MSVPACSNSHHLDALAGASHRTCSRRRTRCVSAQTIIHAAAHNHRAWQHHLSVPRRRKYRTASQGEPQESVGISWTLVTACARRAPWLGNLDRHPEEFLHWMNVLVRTRPSGEPLVERTTHFRTYLPRPLNRPAVAWRRGRKRLGHNELKVGTRRYRHGASLQSTLRLNLSRWPRRCQSESQSSKGVHDLTAPESK